MAREYIVASGAALFDQPLKGLTIRENPNDEERAEYVVAVDWKNTVDLGDARKFPGIFAIQQVTCKIYDAKTVEYLRKAFAVASNSSDT